MKLSRSHRLILFRLLLLLFGIMSALSLAEGGLRLVEHANSSDQEVFSEKFFVEDPKLGHRVAPGAPGHDANGFRNDIVPANADIVVLGDSQTWGINADRSQAWPQMLGKMSGRTVYNMGVGSYGPLHYFALTDKALSFSPKVIVVSCYLGNDLYDAYSLAYSSDTYKDWRKPGASAELLRDTVGPRATALWNEEKNYLYNFGRTDPTAWTLWLSGHTATGRLLTRSGFWPGRDIWFEASKAWAKSHPDHGAVYEEDRVRTVLTTAYRLTALDLDDPQIAEGLRISNLALRRIKDKTDAAGVKLLIVLLPTKESVFASAGGNKQRDPVFEKLVSMESRVREALIAQRNSATIEYVDALPPLAHALKNGQQVYPITTESHPSPKGYEVIARTVAEKVKLLGW